jgi:glucan phosphoethanolaminetransferase (alkaline phosphatase superfamily)
MSLLFKKQSLIIIVFYIPWVSTHNMQYKEFAHLSKPSVVLFYFLWILLYAYISQRERAKFYPQYTRQCTHCYPRFLPLVNLNSIFLYACISQRKRAKEKLLTAITKFTYWIPQSALLSDRFLIILCAYIGQ